MAEESKVPSKLTGGERKSFRRVCKEFSECYVWETFIAMKRLKKADGEQDQKKKSRIW
jgi:hypothetical protein